MTSTASTSFAHAYQESNQVKCLWTIKDVQKEAVQDLGPMDQSSYSIFLDNVQSIAAQAGIVQPGIVLGIVFKVETNGRFEGLYRIDNQGEWDYFLQEAPQRCRQTPHVFVIDTTKLYIPR